MYMDNGLFVLQIVAVILAKTMTFRQLIFNMSVYSINDLRVLEMLVLSLALIRCHYKPLSWRL
jgi:uncharacterized protein (DUF983 family)